MSRSDVGLVLSSPGEARYLCAHDKLDALTFASIHSCSCRIELAAPGGSQISPYPLQSSLLFFIFSDYVRIYFTQRTIRRESRDSTEVREKLEEICVEFVKERRDDRDNNRVNREIRGYRLSVRIVTR